MSAGNPDQTVYVCVVFSSPDLVLVTPQYWEFPNLVISNLVVCNFCALLRPFGLSCALAFALFCGHLRSFALICAFLRPTTFKNDSVWELTPKIGQRRPKPFSCSCHFF